MTRLRICTLVLILALLLALTDGAHAQIGSIIQVTTTADTEAADGACSLREAIIASNTNANADFTALSCQGTGIDSIRFGLGSGTPLIEVGGIPLPTITDRVTIAGNTGGATRVALNGPGGLTGLDVGPTAADSTLRFLVIQQFLIGIRLQGDRSVLISSYIGTDASGMSAVPNGTGVLIEGDFVRVGGTSGTTPGGACTGECNLISSNTAGGIGVDAAFLGENTLIQGNFIGTNALGEAGEDMGNGVGIFRAGVATVGGSAAAARNVISGNTGAGIGGTVLGTVQGNYIGTNSAGTTAVPNLGGGMAGGGVNVVGNVISGNARAGLELNNAQNQTLTGNFIGTAADGVTSLPNFDPGDGTGHGVWFTGAGQNNGVLGLPGNVIAFNDGDGVRVDGPTIRTQIRYNSIHENGGLGINNVAGGNIELPPPSIAVESPTRVSGTSCFTCVSVDVYSDLADEGRIYEGSAAIGGFAPYPWAFDGALTGPNITATQTDINGNTSEFTAPVAIPEPESVAMCVAGMAMLMGLERRRRIRDRGQTATR